MDLELKKTQKQMAEKLLEASEDKPQHKGFRILRLVRQAGVSVSALSGVTSGGQRNRN